MQKSIASRQKTGGPTTVSTRVLIPKNTFTPWRKKNTLPSSSCIPIETKNITIRKKRVTERAVSQSGDLSENSQYKNVTIRRPKKNRPTATEQAYDLSKHPQWHNVTTGRRTAKGPRTHSHQKVNRYGTPVKQREILPIHAALELAGYINNDHFGKALAIMPYVQHYAPTILLKNILNNPTNAHEMLHVDSLPKHIQLDHFVAFVNYSLEIKNRKKLLVHLNKEI